MKAFFYTFHFSFLLLISCHQNKEPANISNTKSSTSSVFKIAPNIEAFRSFDLKKLVGIERLNTDSISYPYIEIKSTNDSLILHCFVDNQIDEVLRFRRYEDFILLKTDSFEEFGRVINHHIIKDSGSVNIIKIYYRSDTTLTRPRTEVDQYAQTMVFEYSQFPLELKNLFLDSLIKFDSDTIIFEKIDQSELDINSTNYNRLDLLQTDDFWHYFFCERFGNCEHWD